ncbi:MAG: choice-of-anchor L domain-containing protein [Saprospiraceae bacterium]
MKKVYTTYSFLSLVFLLLGFQATAQISNEFDSSSEVIKVHPTDADRYTFEMTHSEKLVTLNGLQPGDYYEVIVNPLGFESECVYQIDAFAEEGTISPIKLESQFSLSDSKISFLAKETSVSFHLSNNGCQTKYADQAVVSLLNLSCKAADPEIEADEKSSMGSMAVLSVDNNFSIEELITDVFIGGGCFDVANVQLIGNAQGVGHFSSGSTSIGMEDGVILASGDINNAPGPNNQGGAGTSLPGADGDPDLALLGAGTINDACGIEFDFTPTVETINFDYVFASEEYCEYVGSNFNDVFGFFISGPGFSGPFTGGAENIALIPGTGSYVAINTVNHNQNTVYFNGNAGNCNGIITNPDDIEYDGYTTILTATANVIPCETYHIRMVVSDVGDQIFDSAVFLGANSFQAGGEALGEVVIPGVEEGEVAYEGCADGFLIFEKDSEEFLDIDVLVEFEFDPASTATNGVDYSTITSPVLIPAGEFSVQIPFTVFSDGITEGLETIIITLDNACSCSGSVIEILIDDSEPLLSDAEDVSFCNEAQGSISPVISGGAPEYQYFWNNGSTNPSLDVTGLTTDQTYTVTVTDNCSNSVEEIINVTVVPGPTAEITGNLVVCGENPTGFLDVNFGGVGPWEFIYMVNGSPFGPITTTENPYQLPVTEVGSYQLQSVFSGTENCPGLVSGLATVEETIIDLQEFTSDPTCSGAFDGFISIIPFGGIDPYSYSWDQGQTTETITDIPAGTYAVTVTDFNGCTQELVTAVFDPAPIVLNAQNTAPADCTSQGGDIDLTVSGGAPNYLYNWSNGEGTEDLIGFPPGNYTVTVFDANSCSQEISAVIEGNIVPPVATATGGVLTCAESEVIISGTGNGSNGGPVTFEWFDAFGAPISNNNIATANTPGTYLLIVTDQTNGCTMEAFADVTESLEFPTPVASVDGEITCGQGSAIIDASGSSGSGNLTYQWLDQLGNPIGSGPTVSVNTAGNYSLVVTSDVSGCSSETIAVVAENVELPIPLIDPPALLDCNTISTFLTGSGVPVGGGSTSIEWFGPGGEPLGSDNTIAVDAPGSYSLVVTDDVNGCTDIGMIVVDQNLALPPVDAIVTGVIDCTDGFATISTNSGNSGNDFTWFDPSGTDLGSATDIIVTETGSYSIIVTSGDNGCTSEMMVDVAENLAPPVANAGADATITCASEFALLSGSGSGSSGSVLLEWYNGAGVLMGEGEELEVNQSGTYTLVVTDLENGCTAESPVNVTPDAAIPAIDVTPPDALTCANDLSTLIGSTNATGNIEFGWFDESGNLLSNNSEIDVNESGVYTFVVTNLDNECSAESSVVVADLIAEPVPMAQPDGELTCTETAVVLDGSFSTPFGTLEYEWLEPGGGVIGSDASISVETPGTYTLNIINTENGCTATMDLEVTTLVALPEAVAAPDGLVDCSSNIVTLDGSGSSGNGDLTYSWLNGTTELGSNETQQVEGAGTYTLLITDETNGCTAETIVTVEENLELPVPEIATPDLLGCITQNVTLDGSASSGNGTIELEWLAPDGSPIGSGETVDVTTPGTYTLIVTNEINGCTAEVQTLVDTNDELPDVSTIAEDVLDCQTLSVNITGSASNDDGTLTYEWLDESGSSLGTENTISVAEPGDYIFVATNEENGCTAEMPVTVSENTALPEADAGPVGLLTCDATTVSLDGTNSSSGGNYEYEWTNAGGVVVGNSLNVDVEETGTYTLLVTNTENGCTALATTSVDPDADLPTADAGPGATLTCDVSTANLDGSASTEGAGITYQWLDVNGAPIGSGLNIDVEDAGIYTLLVTNDNNGCSATASVEVAEDNQPPVADPGISSLLDCETSSITLDAGNSTDVAEYVWTDEAGNVISNNAITNVDQAGLYLLEVTAANGCTAASSITVAQDNEVPVADPGPSGLLDCTTTQIELGGNSTSQGLDITYEWTNAAGEVVATTPTFGATAAGDYTLTVFNNNNNCESSASVTIEEDEGLPQASAGAPAVIDCNIIEVTLDGSQSSAGPSISYEWFDPNGTPIGNSQTLDVANSGTYTLIVSDDSNGCSAESQVTISNDLLEPTAMAGPEQLLTCDISAVTLDGTGSTGTSGNIIYEWINAGGVTVGTESTVDVAEAGIYQLVITGENGCTSSSNVEVLLDANIPIADAGPGGDLNCSIDVVTLGGGQTTNGNTITYEWTDASGTVVATTPTFETSNSGIYTLTVFDTANDCNSTSSAEVAESIEEPTVDPGQGGILTCDLAEIILGGGTTTTGPNITYTWTDVNGAPLGSAEELTVTDPGFYTLTVLNNENGCSNFASVTVGENEALPMADAGPDGLLTCLATAYTLDGSSSSTGNNISYEWYNDAGVLISEEAIYDVVTAGDYTLIVNDGDNGCSSTATVTVVPDENAPEAVAAPVADLTCDILEVVLDGSASTSNSGTLTYEWLDNTGNSLSDNTTVNITEPGVYTLLVTDQQNFCDNSITIEINENTTNPIADAGEEATITCDANEVMLTGAATNGSNLTYEWLDPNGVGIGTSESIEVSAVGTYTFVVTNGANGCSAQSEVMVIPDDNVPTAAADVNALLTCDIDMVEINGGGSSTGPNITYEWLNPQGQVAGATQNIDVTVPGTYTLIVFDQSNNCESQTTVLVEENETPPSPNVIAIGGTEINCINNQVVLDAGNSTPFGDLEFEWSTPDGSILGSATTSQIEAGDAGTYNLIVTNTANGCVDDTEFEVTIDLQDPVVNVAAPPVLTCVLTEFEVNTNGTSSNGNFSYGWSSNISSGQGTLTPTITTAGTYTLTVINEDNGCTSSESVTVLEDTEEPSAAAATGDELDCITEIVGLSGSGSSQGNEMVYQWTGPGVVNGANGLSPEVNEPGNYQLIVTNTQNGCTEVALTNVVRNEEAPSAAGLSPEPPRCQGETASLSVVSITGGTPPYTYSIDNGNTFYPDSTFSLFSGSYDVLIQDATGCEYEQSIVVPDAPLVAVQASTPEVAIQLGEGSQLLAVTTIPAWDIDTIMWTPGDSLSCTDCLDPYANPINSTTYQVTVVNKNGCNDMAEIRLDVDKSRDIYIPNAFSPNADGNNDVFMIFSSDIGIEKVNYFQVYNRWGEMVYQAEDFQPNDPAYGWDGWFKAEPMNPAVFVYWAEIEFVDGHKKLFKGDVTLMK